MAERSRVNSSTAAVMASGSQRGIQALQRRAQPGFNHYFARRLATERAFLPKDFLQRRHRLPAKLRKQPNGGLFDKLG